MARTKNRITCVRQKFLRTYAHNSE